MGQKQKPDEVPDEKVSFFCANEKCCNLCRPLGDTLRVNVKNFLSGETYCGLKRNTLIIHITSRSIDCFQELSRATDNLFFLYIWDRNNTEVRYPHLKRSHTFRADIKKIVNAVDTQLDTSGITHIKIP